jgi:hypothetical protein
VPSRRAFLLGLLAPMRSETAEIDEARAAAIFEDALAAIDGRTAVVAVMAGDVVPIARVRRRRLWCAQSGGVADDRGWLASQDRLLEWGAMHAFRSSVKSLPRHVQGPSDISCFRNVRRDHMSG